MQRSRRDPLGLAHPGWVFLATASAILVCDQIAKAVVRGTMQVGQTLSFLPGFVRVVYVRNAGAAFGLFPGGRPLFVLTSVAVLLFIAAYWRRDHPTKWPVVIALAMITAGAVGNLIDRALLGQVTDFFDFMFVDFPVFNVADMGIVCGVGLLMIWILFGPQPATEVDEAARLDLTADTEVSAEVANGAPEPQAGEGPPETAGESRQ